MLGWDSLTGETERLPKTYLFVLWRWGFGILHVIFVNGTGFSEEEEEEEEEEKKIYVRFSDNFFIFYFLTSLHLGYLNQWYDLLNADKFGKFNFPSSLVNLSYIKRRKWRDFCSTQILKHTFGTNFPAILC